ncbi:glycosyl hydrolase family 18 protein [Enterobacter chuandaensis]
MKAKLSTLTLFISASICASAFAAAPGKPQIREYEIPKNLSMVTYSSSGGTGYKQRVVRHDDGLKVNVNWDDWSNHPVKKTSLLLNNNVVWSGEGNAKSAKINIPAGGEYEIIVRACNDDGCTDSNRVKLNVLDTDGNGFTPLDKPLQDNNKPYQNKSGKVAATYYTEWSQYGRQFPVEKIPAQNLTHILYGFVPICGPNESLNLSGMSGSYNTLRQSCQGQEDYTVTIHDMGGALGHVDGIGGNFGKLIALKKAHPQLKILPSIGGWTLSDPFFDMHDAKKRATFIKSVKEYLQTWKFFDGVDIDWEFPGGGGANPQLGHERDKETYTVLMKELRAMLDELSKKDGRTYELTTAIGAGEKKIAAVDYTDAQKYLDYIFVMNYDFAGHFDLQNLNHQTSLYTENNIGPASEHSTEKAIHALLDQQVAPEKLVVGVAEYARAWTGVHGYQPGKPFTGTAKGGMNGTLPDSTGFLMYKEIVDKYSSGDYKKFYDDKAEAAYIFNEKTGELISYDTPRSVLAKGDFVGKYNLGGLFSWEIGNSNGDLLNAMHEGLGNSEGTVDPVNKAPVAVVNSMQTVIAGSSVSLDGSKSYDPENDTLSYEWKQVSGTPVSLDNASAAVVNFSAPATSGELKFTLTVSDGELHSSPAVATVMVKAQEEQTNHKPVIHIAAAKTQSVTSGQKVTFDASKTTDEDGDKLTFNWKKLATGGTWPDLNGAETSIMSFTAPKVTQPTTFTFQLAVSDGKETVISEIYTVNVKADKIPDDNTHWNSAKIYHGGDKVLWNGKNYKAKWWTQGNEPGTNDVWENLDKEKGGEWEANDVYLGGDTVTWQGKTWVAKWWTKGDKPGSNAVWQVQ